MPFSDDLLRPIPGTNPSGQNLRYTLYDAIREARREDDDLLQGEWEHERKKADYAAVLRLCSDALTNKTKDLQLAVWATEAAFVKEGLQGLSDGLRVTTHLLGQYWDTIYPELDDGDPAPRSGVLRSLDPIIVRRIPDVRLTNDGLTLASYEESRRVGYEADTGEDQKKQDAREEAIKEGKLTAEEFDKSALATPANFLQERLEHADACLSSLTLLDETATSKMGNARPSFAVSRERLEELRQTIRILLGNKPQTGEASASVAATAEAETSAVAEVATVECESQREEPSPAISSTPREHPADAVEALTWIVKAAQVLRREQSTNPVPYAVLRALRWAELRTDAGSVDPASLEAPATEDRKRLRSLAQNEQWEELLDACEVAMESPSSRGWLDLQRYAVNACDSLGSWYDPVASAILGQLEGTLRDCPMLSELTFDDGTATASAETRQWLAEVAQSTKSSDISPVMFDASPASEPGGNSAGPDAYELARQAVASNRPLDAIAILERESGQERSGRGRFQRRLQLAQLCMAANYRGVALPLLQSLTHEIDERRLEEWEDPELMLKTFELLYQCIEKGKGSAEQRELIFARICKLGPSRALELAR